MIWCYSQNQKRSSDFFRNVMSCRIELCEKAPKNGNKNGIWSGHVLSSSYAILFFRDIYWISLHTKLLFLTRSEIKKLSSVNPVHIVLLPAVFNFFSNLFSFRIYSLNRSLLCFPSCSCSIVHPYTSVLDMIYNGQSKTSTLPAAIPECRAGWFP